MADPSAAIAAALTMAGTGIATAWAEKVVGGATVGAMAENKGLFVNGLILMVIPGERPDPDGDSGDDHPLRRPDRVPVAQPRSVVDSTEVPWASSR